MNPDEGDPLEWTEGRDTGSRKPVPKTSWAGALSWVIAVPLACVFGSAAAWILLRLYIWGAELVGLPGFSEKVMVAGWFGAIGSAFVGFRPLIRKYLSRFMA